MCLIFLINKAQCNLANGAYFATFQLIFQIHMNFGRLSVD
jgi:hypothetical protein